MVLCRQRKRDAISPTYDPVPFQVTKVEGTKITATRQNKSIVRNKSFFKPFNSQTFVQPTKPTCIDTPSNNRDCTDAKTEDHKLIIDPEEPTCIDTPSNNRDCTDAKMEDHKLIIDPEDEKDQKDDDANRVFLVELRAEANTRIVLP
ncbi:hypothetical protein QE152_g9961 [Popillia japonica]|uniref:Uncharacterized protein n=1 Tax=Popillia japonica TaxID=7064 RepID=A0AAW1LWK3_POPJA